MVNSNIIQNSEMSIDNTGTVSEELRNQISSVSQPLPLVDMFCGSPGG